MRIKNVRDLAAAMALALVAGCASTGGLARTAPADNWGEANRQTMAAQIIDPSPDYGDAPMTTSGDQVAAAINRYRSGQVKKPERVKTSTIGSSGSSGSSN